MSCPHGVTIGRGVCPRCFTDEDLASVVALMERLIPEQKGKGCTWSIEGTDVGCELTVILKPHPMLWPNGVHVVAKGSTLRETIREFSAELIRRASEGSG